MKVTHRIIRISLLLGWVVALALIFGVDLGPIANGLLFFGLCIVTIVVANRLPAPVSKFRVEVDALGARRYRDKAVLESVRWDELVRVSIITTDDGPFAEDFFFALLGSDDAGCLVPNGDAVEHRLMARLGQLPGFDHMAAIVATGSTDHAEFLCWEGPAGSGVVAADVPPDAPDEGDAADASTPSMLSTAR